MNEKIANLCWEFCYEFIPAKVDPEGVPHILILNMPAVFGREIEERLVDLGFFRSCAIHHGPSAVIMQFKKVGLPVSR